MIRSQKIIFLRVMSYILSFIGGFSIGRNGWAFGLGLFVLAGLAIILGAFLSKDKDKFPGDTKGKNVG